MYIDINAKYPLFLSDFHDAWMFSTDLIEMTNNMQMCRTISYSIVP